MWMNGVYVLTNQIIWTTGSYESQGGRGRGARAALRLIFGVNAPLHVLHTGTGYAYYTLMTNLAIPLHSGSDFGTSSGLGQHPFRQQSQHARGSTQSQSPSQAENDHGHNIMALVLAATLTSCLGMAQSHHIARKRPGA